MAQAASFDAAAIAASQTALSAWLDATVPGALSPEQWHVVSQRLAQYRDTCRFLQRTLNQALSKAGRIEGAGYAGCGQSVTQTVPLMRRYG